MQEQPFKFELGQPVTHKISNATGVVTVRAEYLDAQPRYMVILYGDGNTHTEIWVYESELFASGQ